MMSRDEIARIIDPIQWADADDYRKRADEWFAKGRREPGDALTDGYREKANNITKPSLAKADAILARLAPAAEQVEVVQRLRSVLIQASSNLSEMLEDGKMKHRSRLIDLADGLRDAALAQPEAAPHA